MMKFIKILVVVVIIAGAGYYLYTTFGKQAKAPETVNSPSPSATIYPDTQHAIQAFLANKYNRPVNEVHVTIDKEVMGFAAGSVLFGQGGPGEGGMWLAVLGNEWTVVWDGNGNVDCTAMRQQYGFPDTILKPNFCD